MKHPFGYTASGPLVKRVPVQCKAGWADIVIKCSNRLSGAVEQGDDKEIAEALDQFLRMPKALAKPQRGGKKGANKLYWKIQRFFDSVEQGDQELDRPQKHASKEKSEDLRRVARAEDFCRRGYKRKAAMILRSNEVVAEPSPELAERLQMKFPKPRRPLSDLSAAPDSAPQFIQEEVDFLKAIKETFNGSSGGGTGLAGDHIKAVLNFPGVVNALHRLFTLLIDGKFPSWSHPYVCTQRLLSLGEKERPVCIGEWLMCTASKLVEKTVPHSETEDFFLHSGEGYKVLQFGNRIRGGAEAAVFLVEGLVGKEGGGKVVIGKDGSNAYNSQERVQALRHTVHEFPTTCRWATWLYGTPIMLKFGEREWMWAEEGSMQGDALGGRIHDTGLQHALIAAAKKTVHEWKQKGKDDEELTIVAYRDDIYVVADPEMAVMTNDNVDELRDEMTGVKENKLKTTAYCPRGAFKDNTSHATALTTLKNTYIKHDRISTNGMKMLGAPLGDPEYIDEMLAKQVQKYPLFIPRIMQMDKQCALGLLRECHLPIATHLIRMISPEHTIPHAQQLDTDIFNAYTHITEDRHMTRNDPTYHRPFKHGGMGFRSIESTAPIAHYASTVQSINTLARIDASLAHAISSLPPDPPEPPDPPINPSQDNNPSELIASDSPSLPAQIQNNQAEEKEFEESMASQGQGNKGTEHVAVSKLKAAWTVAYNSLPEHHDNEDSILPQSIPILLSELANNKLSANKLQHALTEQTESIRAEISLKHMSASDRARTLSTSNSGSAAPFTCSPTSEATTLPPAAVSSAAQYRIGTLKMDCRLCACGKAVTTPSHVLSCKKLRGRFVRHDCIVNVLMKACSRAGIAVTREVMVIDGTQKRMDLVLHFATGRVWVDVSIVNPQAKSYVGCDGRERREREKQGKWAMHAMKQNVMFVPFILDTFGAMGGLAKKLLARIAASARHCTPIPVGSNPAVWVGKYRREIVERLTVALAYANHCMIEEAAMKAVSPNVDVSERYKGLRKMWW